LIYIYILTVNPRDPGRGRELLFTTFCKADRTLNKRHLLERSSFERVADVRNPQNKDYTASKRSIEAGVAQMKVFALMLAMFSQLRASNGEVILFVAKVKRVPDC
jgi:hypothetical protein